MTRRLNVSEADFLQIKENLKQYLQNQDEFSDYDFDGSAMNTILDILAYSTHYTAMHTNLAFAETFLDSAVQRGSVVSRAKELGYLPRSKTAAKAQIRISFSVTGNPAQYVISKGTKFNATASGTTYTFVTTADHIIDINDSNLFTDVLEVYQGRFTTFQYTVNTSDASQRFIVASKDADTRFLSVLIKDSAQATVSNEYEFISDVSIGDLTADSQVYFLEEAFDGFYEAYFGDGVIGKELENGNVISMTYLITDGADANGARSFTLASTLSGTSNVSITTLEAAFGGGEKESVASIKYLAPFYYQSQGRAVTEDDYKSLIMTSYPDIDDVTVWGGERNDPPYYGKVFIAIKPEGTTYFSNAVKLSIQNDILSRFNVLSIRPEIVDPDYIEVQVNATITYNARLYNAQSNSGLEEDIEAAIEEFFDDEANKFGQPLYYSKLVAAIDDTSTLITNSIVNLKLSKSEEIFPGLAAQYEYNFNNSLHPGAIRSNEFTIDGVDWKIRDIPSGSLPYTTGKIAIYRTTDQGNIVYLTEDTGTVDYNEGTIEVNNLLIDSIVNDPIYKRLTLTVSPGALANEDNPETVYTDYNVYTNERDQIITLKDGGINITLVPDETI